MRLDLTLFTACRFQSRWARIISGADEGVYGWIALNYMTGHLASNPILAADQGLEGTADEPIAVTSASDPSLAPTNVDDRQQVLNVISKLSVCSCKALGRILGCCHARVETPFPNSKSLTRLRHPKPDETAEITLAAAGVAADAHAVHTVGALDLGGSSLEVTFVPAPHAQIVDVRDSRALILNVASIPAARRSEALYLA